MMVIGAEDFINFLLQLQRKQDNYEQVIVSCKTDIGPLTFKRIERTDKTKIDLDTCRTGVPPKYLFYYPREKVYPARTSYPKRIIAGLKACDLRSMEILDTALLKSGFRDPAYHGWRENTTIISSDCSEILSTCCCNLFDGMPYPEKDFDLNISKTGDKYIIAIGSVKGEELIGLFQKDYELREALPDDKEIVSRTRENMLLLLEEQNSNFKINGGYHKLRHAEIQHWMEEAEECIGCGACTNVCPNCYCLILNDHSQKNEFVKIRSYDSCQWHGYARVAGGGTPRPKMHQRFRNRYLCKLDYMKSNFGMSGCTGCGRCTEACPAGIDFRKAVSGLSTKITFE
jgi:sulfhydrogenase subunit beta (sulfur reductase)